MRRARRAVRCVQQQCFAGNAWKGWGYRMEHRRCSTVPRWGPTVLGAHSCVCLCWWSSRTHEDIHRRAPEITRLCFGRVPFRGARLRNEFFSNNFYRFLKIKIASCRRTMPHSRSPPFLPRSRPPLALIARHARPARSSPRLSVRQTVRQRSPRLLRRRRQSQPRRSRAQG